MVTRILPGKQFEVARELRVRVAVAFQREGVVTPRAQPMSRTPVARDGPPGCRRRCCTAGCEPRLCCCPCYSSPSWRCASRSGPHPPPRRAAQTARGGPGATSDQVRADHDVTRLDSDLRARDDDNDNQGSDHLGRPHPHTDASADHDQSEDHREPGDLWKPDTSP